MNWRGHRVEGVDLLPLFRSWTECPLLPSYSTTTTSLGTLVTTRTPSIGKYCTETLGTLTPE